MRNITKVLALGAVFAAAAPLALATPLIAASINVAGSDVFNTTTISFPSAAAGGGQFVTGGSTLNGSPIASGTPVTFTGATLTYSPGGSFGTTGVFIASTSGVSFFVTSETPTYVANNGNGFSTLDLKGTGYFTEAGYMNTPSTFDLTTQEKIGTTAGTITSFSASSATAAVTPEPSSLIMLGTGLVSAAGMMIRRRRIV